MTRMMLKNRYTYSTASPAFCIAAHNVGKIVLGVNNNGSFGTGFAAGSTIRLLHREFGAFV